MGAQQTALAVADKIIRLSIDDETLITPMQAQKLTYFCHAWMLGLGHGPLFQDAVESWQYGPVIRSLYHTLKHYRGNRITQPILNKPAAFTELEERIIQVIWRQYGHLDGLRLSSMTHASDSPWEQTYRKDKRSQIIHNHLIRDYYAALAEQRRAV
jgi:uncharacterized phage-associated protein